MIHAPRLVKRIAVNALLVCASVGIALVLVNVALIVTKTPVHPPVWQADGIFRLDRDLVYSLVPGATRTWTTPEFTERVSINSRGLRGAELRADGTVAQRIVVTGDSVVFGHGVGDDEAFPKRLEALFRAEGRDVEVVNAGVKGYGTDQSFRYFTERLLPLHPATLVFCVNVNDADDNILQPLYTIDNEALVALDATRGPLWRVLWLEDHLPPAFTRTKFWGRVVTRMLKLDWNHTRPSGDRRDLARWARRKMLLEIGELAARSRRDGFRLAVLAVPDGSAARGFEWMKSRLPDGVAFLDADVDGTWKAGRWFLGDHIHLTVEGNAKLARQLHDHLVEQGL